LTHPAAATSASPTPRGTGLGVEVGGHQRQSRRVRYSAPLLTLLLTSPAAAQIIPTGSPAADILLTQALAEHRVFLTCSSLDGLAHPLILQNWQRDVTAATATLTANTAPAEAIAAFTAAAKPENLLPAEDTPWSEVKQFCDATPDWQTDYARLNFTILNLKLPRVFE
jgi:hypothetical protein